MFKIIFDKKNDFTIFRKETSIPMSIDTKGLFHEDLFELDAENQVKIIKSTVRDLPSLCGILILETTTTFGRNKKKCYYLCRPYRKELPSFLIAYTPPNGFIKSRSNLFVRFRFESWSGRLPKGTLMETLGPIHDHDAFCRYQLHCHNLWRKPPPLQASLALKENLPFRTNSLFTIDPKGCQDFDDAFSISEDYISIYIANVPLILDNLKYWHWRQTSSIYSTQQTRHMLPPELSKNLCSLRSDNQKKQCIVLDLHRKTGHTSFSLCQCTVQKNFYYEEPALFASQEYQILSDYAKEHNDTIHDSHDVVSFYMMLFNQYAAAHVPDIIYRATIDCEKYVTYFPYRGTYTCIKSAHAALQNQYYAHFTSPIRRVVDIVNLIQLQKHFQLQVFHDEAEKFVQQWQEMIPVLNDESRQIRKIENQCKALTLFEGTTRELPCRATVLDQPDTNQYEMFVNDHRLILKMKCEDILLLDETYDCMLYLLEHETTYMKKIRLKRL